LIAFPSAPSWGIWNYTNVPGGVPGAYRVQGTVTTSLDTAAIFAPFSLVNTLYLYTWELGAPNASLSAYTSSSQYNSGLKILRPGEALNLTVTIECQDVVGDDVFVFFLRASEDAFVSVANYPTTISGVTDKKNLYYSKLPGPDQTQYWLPLHNSYDPYDADINTGHNFDQNSWTRGPTTTSFSKANKVVHQVVETTTTSILTTTTSEITSSTTITIGTTTTTSFTTITTSTETTLTEPLVAFHICGVKFDDLNFNGLLDFGESGINGVTVTLLGADVQTLASQYYPDNFTYPPPEDQPPLDTLQSGENNLPGSVCFNLQELDLNGGIDGKGTYVFYLKIDEATAPPDTVPTSPTLIGPITLYANPAYWPQNCNINSDPCVYSVGNNFGNGARRVPVGGTISHGDQGAILPVAYTRMLLEPMYFAISVGTYLAAFLPCCTPTLLLAYLALVLVAAVFIVFVARKRRKASQS